MIPLLAHEERSFDPVADEFVDILKGLFIDEYHPDLVALPLHTDRLLLEIDIFDVYCAEFRYADAGGVDQADDQVVPLILDGPEQADHLAVFEVSQLLVLDPRSFHPEHGVCGHDPLGVEVAVERGERRYHSVQGLWLVVLPLRDAGEEIGDEG